MEIIGTAAVDMALVTFALTGSEGADELGGSYNVQIFPEYPGPHWEAVTLKNADGSNILFNIPDGGVPGALSFSQKMPIGHVSQCKVALFWPGINFTPTAPGDVIDFYPLPLEYTVSTLEARIVAPTLVLQNA